MEYVAIFGMPYLMVGLVFFSLIMSFDKELHFENAGWIVWPVVFVWPLTLAFYLVYIPLFYLSEFLLTAMIWSLDRRTG